MQKLIIILLGLFVCSCSVDETTKTSAVRQRFEPTDSQTSGRGANWTALTPAPDRTGAFWVRAHAGLDDSFPVQEKDGPKLFDATVTEGNDEKLLMQVTSPDGIQKFDLPRDKAVTVQIENSKYEWYYPSVYINPDGNPTTDKAFLIVTRLP